SCASSSAEVPIETFGPGSRTPGPARSSLRAGAAPPAVAAFGRGLGRGRPSGRAASRRTDRAPRRAPQDNPPSSEEAMNRTRQDLVLGLVFFAALAGLLWATMSLSGLTFGETH